MIDLKKVETQKALVKTITEQRNIDGQKAQVVVCMDISGSMREMYDDGTVQSVLDRIVPLAMQFDDNQEFELYLFHNEILGKYDFGGTSYAPAIRMITEDYTTTKKADGMFGFLKQSKREKINGPLEHPVYVIYITDGQNDDKRDTEEIIREASKYGIFLQFVGIGGASFQFLEKLDDLNGRLIDNANFFKATNIKAMSDDELYSKLLVEFPGWVKLAKNKNLIR
jgi:hypothetical protein